ncbi:LacI family DNA-binding transcriptional regulator [Labrys monachus]|uniref:DNA-binding LacI/PurR family transcriptional regulator n=1 Tax=Labrys monachus TaxID=217067 RepID=A0ABU0FGP3_9HYPH|nr:LacI family DNA-binding transcriptional regulator [Labrys monachus]MDQ0393273.1 DNA-binding LacI/PurR family transcriptional regulator [Labrys monachus]
MSDATVDRGRIPRITVKDLARQLGMSVSTVSRAFYDDAVIAPETREKVLRRAVEIGYQPNPLARGLITKSSRIVGLVVSDITNPFYPEVMVRLTEQFQAEDFNVMLVVASPTRNEEEAVRVLLSYHPDLVVMLATTLSSAASASCRKVGTPVVFFNRVGSDENSYAVTCDNVLGGRLIADHLIDRGHRRLGFVAGRPDASTNVDRWHGFQARCAERGVAPPASTGGVAFSYEAGFAGALDLLNREEKPTALFCANDILAIGAMDAARRGLGLSIPADLSVIGFDDIGMASWSSHALTTVRQPIARMIDRTTALALALARGNAVQPAVERLPGELIDRNTTRFIDGQ